LACAQRPGWRFLCTEIDDKNRQTALHNIAANNLGSRIRIIDTDKTGEKLIPTDQLDRFERVDVLVTNPPFYSSEAELLGSAGQKSRPPNSSCTGAAVEMITPGGEVSFVGKLVRESAQRRNRRKIQWFSAMLGKLSSVGAVVAQLRNQGCTNLAVTEFVQGQKTRRWCVAWSWMGFRPGIDVARGVGSGSGVERKWLPPPTEMDFEVEHGDGDGDADADARDVAEKVTREIRKLDGVVWKFDSASGVGMFMAREGDVWSRKARRKAKAKGKAHQDTVMQDRESEEDDDAEGGPQSESESESDLEPALVARILIKTLSPPVTRTGSKPTIHIRHLQGHDAVLFESFCGWLKRKVVPPST
jgi:23S rRNA (adenine1618-N6)-methyltransferase